VIDLHLRKRTAHPLAWPHDQEPMIALHAEQFGETYVKAVERAAKGNYKFAQINGA